MTDRDMSVNPTSVLRAALALLPLLLTTAATVAAPPPCDAELAAVDRNFAQAMVRVLEAGAGPPAEQCAALRGQVAAIAAARAAHLRCYPPGERLDALIAWLDTSSRELRGTQATLGCNASAAL
jgi:hypothetical protein